MFSFVEQHRMNKDIQEKKYTVEELQWILFEKYYDDNYIDKKDVEKLEEFVFLNILKNMELKNETGILLFHIENEVFITQKWFVERYCLTQSRLEGIYKKEHGNGVIYAMGIKKELKDNELDINKLYIVFNNQYHSLRVQEYNENSQVNIKYLIENFNKIFGIDLNEFNNYPDEKIKLIYLLHKFSRDNGNIKYAALFKTRSIENKDVSFYSEFYTQNGYILKSLKDEIIKELDLRESTDFRNINDIVAYTYNKCEDTIRDLNLNLSNINRLNRELKGMSRLWNVVYPAEKTEYKHSLLETFYLKLCAFELIGVLEDIIEVIEKVNEEYSQLNIKKIYGKINEIKGISGWIDINDISAVDDFLSKNKALFITLLYQDKEYKKPEKIYDDHKREFIKGSTNANGETIKSSLDNFLEMRKELVGDDFPVQISPLYLFSIFFATVRTRYIKKLPKTFFNEYRSQTNDNNTNIQKNGAASRRKAQIYINHAIEYMNRMAFCKSEVNCFFINAILYTRKSCIYALESNNTYDMKMRIDECLRHIEDFLVICEE